MSKQGSYDVNGHATKDSFFRSFICALLVFLALCVAIYLLLVLGKNTAKVENPKNRNDNNEGSEKDALQGTNNILAKLKNSEESTTNWETEDFKEATQRAGLLDAKLVMTDNPGNVGGDSSILYDDLSTGVRKFGNIFQSTPNSVTTLITSSRKKTTTENSTALLTTEVEKKVTRARTITNTIQSSKLSEISTVSLSDVVYFDFTTLTPITLNGKENKTIEYSSPLSTKDVAKETKETPTGTFQNNFQSSTEIYTPTSTPITLSEEENKTIQNAALFSTTDVATKTGGTPTGTFQNNFQSSTEINTPRGDVHDDDKFDLTSNFAETVTSITKEVTKENSIILSTIQNYIYTKGVRESTNILTSSKNQTTTENSTPLSTTEVEKEDIRTKTFTNTIQSSNLSEISTVSLSDAVYFDFTTLTPLTSSDEKNTIQSSALLSTKDVSMETEGTPTGIFRNIFQSSTETDILGGASVLVNEADMFDMTSNFAETVTSITESVTKKTSMPLSAIQNYIHTKDTTVAEYILEENCNTVICKRTTSQMLNLIDYAADPCINFYEFACGNHQSNNNFLQRLNFEKVLNYATVDGIYLKEFKSFYESCVNHERDFKFVERTKLMEYRPYNNLTELFVDLILTQSMPLFDIGLDIVKDTQRYALQMTLPGRSSLTTTVSGWSLVEQIRKECLNEQNHLARKSEINLNDIYSSFKGCQKLRFKNSAKNVIDNLRVLPTFQNETIYSEVNLQKLLDLLKNIQMFSLDELTIQEARVKKDSEIYRIKDINKIYNKVDWKIILESITINGEFDEEKEIEVYFPDHLKRSFNHLQKYKEWELMEILGLYTKLQLYENTIIPKDKENRENYCMKLSTEIMPDVVSVIMYEMATSDAKFHKQNKNMEILFDDIKSQFNKSIEKTLDDIYFKESLKEELGRTKLGLITRVDYNSTRDNYKEITMSNNFQKNIVCLLRNRRKIIYSLHDSDASAGSLLTHFINPFYTLPKTFYRSKYIVFHPTIFQRTAIELPYYIILSTIGLHLSQELAKHFDPIGGQYKDSPIDFSTSYESITKQTNYMLDIFLNNTYELEGKLLKFQMNNNILWTTEMIADNTAFRLIEDLFNPDGQENLPWTDESYPVDKVFFITAAQEYCKMTTALDFMEDMFQTGILPPSLKIQNMMSNSKKFSETFECADDSPMKLFEEQRVQFPYVQFSSTDNSLMNNK